MNNYLCIPAYYTNLQKNIYSSYLTESLQEKDILNYLRDVYRTDITLFYNIRDELLLRGIVFKREYQNNIFPSLQYEIKHVITINDPGENYLKIDNSVTGIQGIVNRYKVESDYFFMNVPLEGLAYALNKNGNFLTKQLEKAGFEIVPAEHYSAKDFNNGYIIKEEEGEKYSPTKHEIEIEDYFNGNEFIAFIRYCYKHRKKFLSQLTIDFVEEFQHVKGVGRKKYNKVIECYKEIDLNNDKPKEIIRMTPFEFFVNNPLRRVLERKNKDYSSFLDSLYVTEEQEIYLPVPSELFDEKVIYIKNIVHKIKIEIKEKEFRELKNEIINHSNYPHVMDMSKGDILRLFNLKLDEGEDNIHLVEMIENLEYQSQLELILSGLEKFKPVNKQILEINRELSERELEVIVSRLDKTLEEVGNLIGVTRERVRQIERKILNKLQNKVNKLHLDLYFNHFLQNNISMTLDYFMDKLNIDHTLKNIFRICVSLNKRLEFWNETIINKNLSTYVQKLQNTIKMWDTSILNVSEVLNKFSSDGEYEFTVQTIDMFMKEIGYKRKNSLYFKSNIKLPEKIAYLFKNKIKGSMEMTEEAFDYIQELMDEVFDSQFESGKRAAIARIRDTKNVILVESNTFIYFDLDAVQQELLDAIENAIEESLNMDHMVTANTLYQRYNNIWGMYNIKSHYHLYSILQYHFADVYVIGKGNTLAVFRSSEAKVDNESILIAYLENKGVTCSKQDILDHFRWPSYKLEQLISRSKEIMTVQENGIEGYGIKLLSSFGFLEDELEKLLKFLNEFMQESFFFPMDLFIEMEFDDDLSEILAKRNITNLYTFVSIIKYLNPDLRGFQQLLYIKDSDINTIERVITHTFKDIVRRDQLEDFLSEKGYSFSSITSVINSLLDSNSFYIYTSYQFINAEQIDFNNDVKESLKDYLNKAFGNKSYLSALDLTGYTTDIMAVSRFEWQPQLITAFVQEVGYRYIRTTADYRYNKWILVCDDLNVTNYEELVHYILTHEYDGNLHEKDIAKYLEAKKLTHSPYQLPLEIKTSKLFVVKDLGFVEVKERRNGINRFTTRV